MVFIYLFSHYRFPDPAGGDPSIKKFSILPFLHMGEFGLLTVILMWAFYPQVKSYYLAIISIIYGITDEIHQYFIPYRWFDYKDIMYDSIGAITGIIVYFVFFIMFILICNYKNTKVRKNG